MDAIEKYRQRRKERLAKRMREAKDKKEAARWAVILYTTCFKNVRDKKIKEDADDDIEWVTINGARVPLKNGKAVGGALKGKKFISAKSEKSEEKSGSSKGTEATAQVSATGANTFSRGFSKSNLNRHWTGSSSHKDEYPNMSKQEYAQRALELIQKPVGNNILGYKNSDGQVIRYDKNTNDFVKGNPEIGISTMFKPSAGERYYQRQKKKEGVADNG